MQYIELRESWDNKTMIQPQEQVIFNFCWWLIRRRYTSTILESSTTYAIQSWVEDRMCWTFACYEERDRFLEFAENMFTNNRGCLNRGQYAALIVLDILHPLMQEELTNNGRTLIFKELHSKYEKTLDFFNLCGDRHDYYI